MGEHELLTPEDDLFGRVALFNKLITLNQIVECSRVISDEVVAGKPRHSLASVLIARRYISAQAAGAVQKAVHKKVVHHVGEAPPAVEGLPPEPKPMKKRAPVGDSQVLVPVKDRDKQAAEEEDLEDKRFQVKAPKRAKSALLEVDCHNLYPTDSPAFEAACRRLVESEKPDIYIDLRKVRHAPSVIIGVLGKVSAEAAAAGLHLVLLAGKTSAKAIQMILGNTVEMRVS